MKACQDLLKMPVCVLLQEKKKNPENFGTRESHRQMMLILGLGERFPYIQAPFTLELAKSVGVQHFDSSVNAV